MSNGTAFPGPARRGVQAAGNKKASLLERNEARRKRLALQEASGLARCPECSEFQPQGFATCQACGEVNPGREVTMTGSFEIELSNGGSGQYTVIDLGEVTCRHDEIQKVLCREMGIAISRLRKKREIEHAPVSKAQEAGLLP